MVTEFVTDDSASMRDQGANEIFLQLQCQVEVRPSLVAVFQSRHAEDQVMHILNVTLALTLVAQAQHHTRDLDECQCHVVACSVHHLCQIIGALSFLLLIFAIGSMQSETFVFVGLSGAGCSFHS